MMTSTPLTKVFTIAHVPPELEQAWLQHLRDFYIAHPGCHFEVGLESPNVTLAEAIERLRVEPALTFTKIFERVAGPTDEADRTDILLNYVAERDF